MRVVNMRELKLNTKNVLHSLSKDRHVLITQLGKPIALLRSIDTQELSNTFTPLWGRLQDAVAASGYTKKDVPRLIATSRKPRK